MFRILTIRLERTDDLVRTVNMSNEACQCVLDRGQMNKQYNKYKLDRATYKGIREDFPSLPSARC